MDAPDIPRARDGPRKIKHRLSNLTFMQYPHTSKGKTELRMESKANDRPPTAASTVRERPKPTTTNTALRVGRPESHQDHHSSSSEALNEPTLENPPGSARRYAGSTASTHSPDFSDFDDAPRTASIDHEYSRHSMHVPTRTSSQTHGQPASRVQTRRPTTGRKQSISALTISRPASPEAAPDYGPGDRSSAESVFSKDTAATSIHTLPALQTKGPDSSDAQYLEPLTDDDPRSFDLLDAPQETSLVGIYALERRGEQMFSSDHLQIIFDDPKLLLRFTGYLNSHRPKSIPVLIYYLDALKALRALAYSNAVMEALDPIQGYAFTNAVAQPTVNAKLEEKARQAFELLVRDDLPAYIAHTWVQVVSLSIQRRITGTLAPHLREASEGLAEVFCLTDPSRPDNPIVFASEEFTRTTQYGMGYVIGRNCRFLQGPKTNPNSVRRLAEACVAGKELTEVFVNYRRDGSPFMNLLMIAPLYDSRGTIRYYIGAQVDCSGLAKDCSDLDGLSHLVERDRDAEAAAEEERAHAKDEFQELSEMFNGAELETVRRCGGRMHKDWAEESDADSIMSHSRPRLLLQDPTQDTLDRNRDSIASMAGSVGSTVTRDKINGKLEGVYQHYLLVRPAPSLRILFTSPSLRVPGVLQSPFLHRIGGSPRVRADLAAALGEGRGVTAKIRWLSKADEDGDGEGRARWIHCTPLLGHSGAVGVWMIILVEEEGGAREHAGAAARRFRPAPPVATNIGGKEWSSSSRSRERRHVGGAAASLYEHADEPRRPSHGAATPRLPADPYELVARRPGASRVPSGRSTRTAHGREGASERDAAGSGGSGYGGGLRLPHGTMPGSGSGSGSGGQSVDGDAGAFAFGVQG
ncbi:hypothetical protein LTR53_000325 [Teratosphaeriaceae sp. CCFEE 6253]|nr:hypothetical protein LTR53_000325 [Teratosphaeriaceae sp. CCFEE 6253]